MIRKIAATLSATLLVAWGATSSPAVATGGDHPNEPCVPSDGTPASFSKWHLTQELSDWGTVPPADPDGQSGEDNPLNLEAVGPQRAERVVTDEEGGEEVVSEAYIQRYSLVGGSWPEGATPAFPDPGEPFRWQPNVKGDPHGIGHPGAYDVSNEHSGNTDWFYLEFVEAVTEWHPPVTHREFQWGFLTRTYTPGTDPVECPPVDQEVPVPAQPDTIDPCGPDNIHFALPDDDNGLYWTTLENGGAKVTLDVPGGGFVFEGGGLTRTFPLPADSGAECPTRVERTHPEYEVIDPCGVKDDDYEVTESDEYTFYGVAGEASLQLVFVAADGFVFGNGLTEKTVPIVFTDEKCPVTEEPPVDEPPTSEPPRDEEPPAETVTHKASKDVPTAIDAGIAPEVALATDQNILPEMMVLAGAILVLLGSTMLYRRRRG